MKETLRFRAVSKLKITETEEYQELEKDTSKLIETEDKEQQYIELPIYDVSLEQISFTEIGSLNTEVKEIAIKQTAPPLYDTVLTNHTIKPDQTPDTNFIQVLVAKEMLQIADIKLFVAETNNLSTSLNTDIAKAIQIDKPQTENVVSHFDLELESKTLVKQISGLDTEVLTTQIRSGLETFASSGEQNLPIFENFIDCDKRFPRSFSESFNSPFIVLIGEDEKEWHFPIIYALKELFREITDKHPRVTFREPELFEEGLQETVDSLDPHSLDQFAFEYKIEFLDARKMHLAVNEFIKIVRGRLRSGSLQQFGVLIIAVKRKDLDRARKALKFEEIPVYTCSCDDREDDSKYEAFCSKLLGVNSSDTFFRNLRKCGGHLSDTHRRFSIFVKRGPDASDKLQYPLKVVTFVYLLDDLRSKMKRITNNFEEVCEFANEVLEQQIKVEAPILEGRVIPDLIYSLEAKEIYVEIETLIGTFEPLKKIDETIEKYKEINIPNATIWIVLKPVSAMIHYEELKARKKAYKILYHDKTIDFKVLTCFTSKGKFKWDLVNIDEFLRDKNVE